MGKDENCVDAETKLYIEESNKEQTIAFQNTLREFGNDLKEWMKNQFNPVNKDIDHLKTDTERLRGDVADLYNKDRDMRDRVSKLEQRQSTDEGKEIGAAGSEQKNYNKKTMNWVIIGGVVTIFGLIAGVVFK